MSAGFFYGQFVRIRMPLGSAYNAVLVAEKAFGSDQGQKHLLVVGPDDVVQYRRVGPARWRVALRLWQRLLGVSGRSRW